MVHLQNALSENARSESQQTIEIEKEFQKLRWCYKRIILQIFDRNTFSEKLTEAKEKVKTDNDRVKPIEQQFQNILRMVFQ